MTISFVIPTIGRPTLHRTLASLAPQLGDGDEVIVVVDPVGDPVEAGTAFVAFADERWTLLYRRDPGDDHGYGARNIGDAHATRDALHHMDDDDIYTPDAVAIMRPHIRHRCTVFFREQFNGYRIWKEPVFRVHNLGSACGLIPNVKGKLGAWASYPGAGNAGGDYVFFAETLRKQGGEHLWVDEVVCLVRPP